MPRSRSSSTNGGVIGKKNPTSFGKCTVTTKTSTGTVCLQSGTRVIDYLLVAGGGGGGAGQNCGPGCNETHPEDVLVVTVHFPNEDLFVFPITPPFVELDLDLGI